MADKMFRLEDREGAAEAIRRMSEEDLRYLNRLIVERLKLISQAKSTSLLACFSVGDKVVFQSPEGKRKTGTIQKLNKKTATILTEERERWNVYPGFLSPLGTGGGAMKRRDD